MPLHHSLLERQILTAFKQAHAERRLDVAERLLRALETLQPDTQPGSATAEAYMTLAPTAGRHRTAVNLGADGAPQRR